MARSSSPAGRPVSRLAILVPVNPGPRGARTCRVRARSPAKLFGEQVAMHCPVRRELPGWHADQRDSADALGRDNPTARMVCPVHQSDCSLAR
jgi:hypothetical protein